MDYIDSPVGKLWSDASAAVLSKIVGDILERKAKFPGNCAQKFFSKLISFLHALFQFLLVYQRLV